MVPHSARALLAAASLAGCTIGPSARILTRATSPSAQAVSLAARSFDRSHAMLELVLEVDNPGPSLTVQSAQYEVFLDGRAFASGVVALEAPVPAKDRARLAIDLALAYLDLPYSARAKAQRGEPLQVVARGVLRAQGETIAFAAEAPLTARSEGAQER